MEKLIDISQLGEILGRSVGALRNDLSRNPARLPAPIRIGQAGRLLRWRQKDVQVWIDQLAAEQQSSPRQKKRRRPGRPTKSEQIRRG